MGRVPILRAESPRFPRGVGLHWTGSGGNCYTTDPYAERNDSFRQGPSGGGGMTREAKGELVVAALVVSALVHVGVMLYAKPKVMTHVAAGGSRIVARAQNALAKGDVHGARGYATVVTTLFADPALVAAAERVLKESPETKKVTP